MPRGALPFVGAQGCVLFVIAGRNIGQGKSRGRIAVTDFDASRLENEQAAIEVPLSDTIPPAAAQSSVSLVPQVPGLPPLVAGLVSHQV